LERFGVKQNDINLKLALNFKTLIDPSIVCDPL